MSIATPSSLEPRFLEPPGWRWHHFKNARNKKLRFGTTNPENGLPAAVVVILPGRTEYAEKYFELAHDLLKQNFGIWILEWQGQGLSDRLIPSKPQHNHSPSFEQHVADLHQFILEYVHPEKSHVPIVMLAHSMGANIGMRYLHKHPDAFKAAALTAPLLGILALKKIPVGPLVTRMLSLILGKSYAFGQKDWSPESDPEDKVLYSSDPVRKEIYGAWFHENENLRVGGVTFGWIYNALRSCLFLQKTEILKTITTPCLIALAGEERLVDNDAIRRAAAIMPQAQLLELAGSGHEILMERDDIRNRFLDAFTQLIK